MTRPTKAMVDAALAVCDRDHLSASSYPVILADEVRALRDELERIDTVAKRVFGDEFRAELQERTAECAKLREELAEMRCAAVAFALVAARESPTLVRTETIAGLVLAANRCRPPGTPELTLEVLGGES